MFDYIPLTISLQSDLLKETVCTSRIVCGCSHNMEGTSVDTHFNNIKSLRKTSETLPFNVWSRRINRETGLSSKVRKRAKKLLTAYDVRWIMRQIKNNP